MRKYLHLVLFPFLLTILWMLSVEYLHVFQNYNRIFHWTLLIPLSFLMWATVFTKEHRYMLRALGYQFRHASKELMWHEVFEALEKTQVQTICLLHPEHMAPDFNPKDKWKPVWTDNDQNLVHKANAVSLACQQMSNYYITYKASFNEKRIFRRWSSGGASDIYIIASFLNVM